MDIYITGIAQTKLGRFPELSVKQLSKAAIDAALADAVLSRNDIEAAWFSNVRQGQMEGQNSIRGQCALFSYGFSGIPIFNVENACASSSSALFQAFCAVKSGLFKHVLVVGAEKMYYPNRREDMMNAFRGGTDIHELENTWQKLTRNNKAEKKSCAQKKWAKQSFFMDIYAHLACQHMKRYGLTQNQIALAASKNHHNARFNSFAQYRTPLSVEQVLESPLISWPLTRAMCAPISDGAAALILSSANSIREEQKKRAIRVRGMGIASTVQRKPNDLAKHCVTLAAKRAYQMANIQPKDIHVVEVHDATSSAEILQIENLGLCPQGQGGTFIESGAGHLDGQQPINPSGGLVSKGHPIAATGLIQLYELSTQLRGEAGERQVKHARIGVAENGGGFISHEDAAAVVTVLDGME